MTRHFVSVSRPTVGGVAFIELAHELDLVAAEELRQGGARLITYKVETLRIDMSRVTFIDAAGIGALIWLSNVAHASGCDLILQNPTPYVSRTLDLAGLTDVLTAKS